MPRLSRASKVIISIAAIILFVAANQMTIVQHFTARAATKIYVGWKYNHLDLEYEDVEFSPQFGDYSVAYKDKEGRVYGFMVAPKSMPVIILHDPLNERP
ncbi:hypothetical protein LCM10_13990 [Rossellomorea aquimaris]|uniref:hypothetical protein n=1 Tax=Rossellomorea aquimaris TaxID=189382 RepID=UPI001CD1DD91|nr:hypothetical protein [Rossellomorea aquimaris]MCA1056106.1 hypothetical protein [Rossellomorea aquimaris]